MHTATTTTQPASVRTPTVRFQRALPGRFAAVRDAVMDAKGGLQSLGLTRHPAAWYATHTRCYLSEDETTGYAVTHDGELVSLFSAGVPGAGRAAVLDAVFRGATSLWCFDGFLPRYYTGLGWRECERLAWDDALAPAGWPYDVHGRPDVVRMAWPERPSILPPAAAVAS